MNRYADPRAIFTTKTLGVLSTIFEEVPNEGLKELVDKTSNLLVGKRVTASQALLTHYLSLICIITDLVDDHPDLRKLFNVKELPLTEK